MKKGGLFASILAAAAVMFGATPAADSTVPQYASAAQNGDAQVTGTKTPASAPVANATSELVRAGATVIPIPVWYTASTRWAWVGRKVNGRFGYYCRRVA
jgi:hypothetical protein